MKRLVLNSIMFAMALTACQNESYDLDPLDNPSTDMDGLTGVPHDIMVNILSSKFEGYKKGRPATRAMSSFSLTPYVEDGDTLLYIAQYADGWEIYSANQATSMVLFSSDHGQFDINDPDMPSAVKDFIYGDIELIRNLSRDSIDFVDKSWGAPSFTDEDFASGTIRVKNKPLTRASYYPEVPPGEWILLENELVSTDIYNSPKLTVTLWDQKSPWNKYTKLVPGGNNTLVQALVGCTSVAVGQYMYYTHFHNGIPATTVANATPINNGADYSFYGTSSTIWDDMAPMAGYFTGMKETALFLGYLGRQMDASYGANSTSVLDRNWIAYVNKIYSTTFTMQTFDYNYIKQSIDNNMPVMCKASSDKNIEGEKMDIGAHAFLVDRYREMTTTRRYLYALKRDPWPNDTMGDDPYESDDIDEFGNIISYAYTNEIIKTDVDRSIFMNWGYSGIYDSMSYHPNSSYWEFGDRRYNLEHIMLKRADM